MSRTRVVFLASLVMCASSQSTDVVELPPFLAPLPTTDPQFSSLNASGAEYALGAPGEGGVSAYAVVAFTQKHDVYRLWGGPAEQCGYWWTLAPDSGTVPGLLPLDEYMYNYAATCPAWNNGTNITRCTVEPGVAAVVGPAQTATCPSGYPLDPVASPLQLNSDVCGMDGVSCTSCAAVQEDLADSKCVIADDDGDPGVNDDSRGSKTLIRWHQSTLRIASAIIAAVMFNKIAHP